MIMSTINEYVQSLNSSTFFAGIMMICLNIGSRYVQLNLTESTEQFIKYALTKELLVFTVAWMGTRNIYMALVLTAVFVVLADFIMNENSKYCLLPKKFLQLRKAVDINNDKIISEKEINDANELLEKAKKQKKMQNHLNYVDYYNNNKI